MVVYLPLLHFKGVFHATQNGSKSLVSDKSSRDAWRNTQIYLVVEIWLTQPCMEDIFNTILIEVANDGNQGWGDDSDLNPQELQFENQENVEELDPSKIESK